MMDEIMMPTASDLAIGMYNPVLMSLFIVSWTAEMAAMMFPVIVPIILLYNKLLENENAKSTIKTTIMTINKSKAIGNDTIQHFLKIFVFVGIYLVIWALARIGLLFGLAILMNYVTSILEKDLYFNTEIIFGLILIVSGLYQFSSLKNKCIGYCESPLNFFMRRWKNGKVGAMKRVHIMAFIVLGCCWPYFLIMVALGWMNIGWMLVFSLIFWRKSMVKWNTNFQGNRNCSYNHRHFKHFAININ